VKVCFVCAATSSEEDQVSSIRILVVDDYKDWRTQVRLLLQGRPECQIIFEASDGLEGVQRAEELKPDLILLDVGLPKLNGIEAAGRIRRRSPGSKIVFVSGNSSRDVVQVAMSTGAYGYVYKERAQSDLLPAIDAALRGIQFVSGGIDRDALTDPPGASAPSHHEILFYSDDEVLLDRLVRFVAAALKTGDVAIVVATESHRDHLVQRLKTEGVDVDAAIKEGKYVPVDAGGTLRIFMVNEMPDSARFFEVVGGLIEEAAKKSTTEHPRIAVFGELVSLLWNEDNRDAALRLEKLWNQLARSYEIDLLCGYAKSNFHGKKDEHVFQEICAEHSVVFRA
jgi:DNA-binding NarL/FixJ family response regulator